MASLRTRFTLIALVLLVILPASNDTAQTCGVWENATVPTVAYAEVGPLAHGSGTVVSAGYDVSPLGYRVWTSVDEGATWTTQRWDSHSALTSAAWGNGTFVVVGNDGLILSSPDGLNWTRRPAGVRTDLTRVIWAGRQFVALGGYDRTLTSPDGVTWTSHGHPASGPYFGIAWNGERYVAVGHLATAVSRDLETWTVKATPVFTRFWGVAWGGGRFVAVGGGGIVLVSTDGESWTVNNPTPNHELTEVIYSSLGFVAGGYSGNVLRSDDGENWDVLRTSPKGGSIIVGVAWTGKRLVVADGALGAPPIRRTACTGRSVYVPSVAHTAGVGTSRWRSDLALQNAGPGETQARLEALPWGAENTSPPFTYVTLAPGTSARIADVLMQSFGFEGAATLRLTSTSMPLVASARTYNDAATGTYGQFIGGVQEQEAIAFGQAGVLTQLSQSGDNSSGFRTNVGLVSASTAPITVEVEFRRSSGALLGSKSVSLRPYESTQLNKAVREFTQETVDDAYAIVRTTTEGGTFFAYASVIDNRSNAPIHVPAVKITGWP